MNFPLMLAVCALHVAIVFLQDAQHRSGNADAHLYYYGLGGYLAQPLGLGTTLVAQATYGLRMAFDLSFLDMMLIFGLIGTCPILMLLAQVETRVPKGHRLWALAGCMLPGLFFWTSLIGKDAITTAGIALIMVCAGDLPRRVAGFVLGMLIVIAIRPHVALLLAGCFGVSRVALGSGLGSRIGLILLGIASLPLAVLALQSFIGVNILSLSELSQFFNEKQSYVAGTADEGVVYIANPIERVIYFLFRPFFFDANSALSLAASFENLAVLSLLARIAFVWRKYGIGDRQNAVFYALSIIALMLFLGLTGYNVGLALRQKVMFYPALASLLIMAEARAARVRLVKRSPPTPLVSSRHA